MVTGLAAA
jgi:hypothetical protein